MIWPVVTLGSLVIDERSGASLTRDEFTDTGVAVVPKKAISESVDLLEETLVYTSREKFMASKSAHVSNRYLITTLRNLNPDGSTLGLICRNNVSGEFMLAQGVHAFLFDERVDLNYICYASRQPEFRAAVQRVKVGSTQVHMRARELKDIEIPLPPLLEQKRIAAILDKAAAIRRKRQQAIQLADDFLRAVFLDMFGDPVTNPKGWEVNGLEELSTRITKGESPKWQGFEYGSEGVRFITSENVLWGSLDERMKFIPLEFHQKLKRSQVQEGDLLINLVGASVGRACLAELNGMPANINQAVSVTTLDHSRLLPEIALYQLLVPSMQRVLLGSAVDAARANISLADIRDLQMLVPPIDVQLAFLKVLRKVKKYMAVNSSFSGLNLFESLSHNAFSGQL